jgi:rhodanese-related sulfurtransferase
LQNLNLGNAGYTTAMMIKLAELALVCAVAATLAAGCHSSSSDQATPSADTASPAPKSAVVVTVAEVQSFIQAKSATVFDANDDDTRKEYGTLPGAHLLASHKDYPLSLLPNAKSDKLVFYCGGTQCRASDAAAARASSAGYSDVNVMRAGIRGWKDAGYATSPPPQS